MTSAIVLNSTKTNLTPQGQIGSSFLNDYGLFFQGYEENLQLWSRLFVYRTLIEYSIKAEQIPEVTELYKLSNRLWFLHHYSFFSARLDTNASFVNRIPEPPTLSNIDEAVNWLKTNLVIQSPPEKHRFFFSFLNWT